MTQQKQKNDISNIEDISKKYKKKELEQVNIELRALCAAQDLTIQKLHESLTDKEAEIAHLKTMLSSTVPIIGKVERIEASNEDLIAEIQLKKLLNKAEFNELTLEEARKLEIFFKIKNAKKENVINPMFTPIKEDPTKLLEIANTQIKKDDNE